MINPFKLKIFFPILLGVATAVLIVYGVFPYTGLEKPQEYKTRIDLGNTIPQNLEQFVPQSQKIAQVESYKISYKEGTQSTMAFYSPQSVKQLSDYYRGFLGFQGWVTLIMNNQDNRSFFYATKAGEVVNVSITTIMGISYVTISMFKK